MVMNVTLNTPIASVMTNKRRMGALKSLGVLTVGDALTYYPFRVTDPVPLRAVREAKVGRPRGDEAKEVLPRLDALVDKDVVCLHKTAHSALLTKPGVTGARTPPS